MDDHPGVAAMATDGAGDFAFIKKKTTEPSAPPSVLDELDDAPGVTMEMPATEAKPREAKEQGSKMKKGFFASAKPPKRDKTAAYYMCTVHGHSAEGIEICVRRDAFKRRFEAVVLQPFFDRFFAEAVDPRLKAAGSATQVSSRNGSLAPPATLDTPLPFYTAPAQLPCLTASSLPLALTVMSSPLQITINDFEQAWLDGEQVPIVLRDDELRDAPVYKLGGEQGAEHSLVLAPRENRMAEVHIGDAGWKIHLNVAITHVTGSLRDGPISTALWHYNDHHGTSATPDDIETIMMRDMSDEQPTDELVPVDDIDAPCYSLLHRRMMRSGVVVTRLEITLVESARPQPKEDDDDLTIEPNEPNAEAESARSDGPGP